MFVPSNIYAMLIYYKVKMYRYPNVILTADSNTRKKMECASLKSYNVNLLNPTLTLRMVKVF